MPEGRATASSGIAALLGLCLSAYAQDVSACGGFFCGRQPAEQSAEGMLLEVGEGTVTLTTPISFSGQAADFAWVLPLAEVPDPDSLAVLSQQALNALDTKSDATFLPACPDSALDLPCQNCDQAVTGDGGVDVYLRTEVGPYDVSVVGSRDPEELVQWLRDAGYRITPLMEPDIAAYSHLGMKFLALELLQKAGVQDIQALRFSVSGTSPSSPLCVSALAAEPELPVLAFVLPGDRERRVAAVRPLRDGVPIALDMPGAGLVPGTSLRGGGCNLSGPMSGAQPRWLALGLLAAGLRSRRRRRL